MAIDSQKKRFSLLNMGLYLAPTVVPDAAMPQGWRQAVVFGYSGNLWAGVIGAVSRSASVHLVHDDERGSHEVDRPSHIVSDDERGSHKINPEVS